MSTTEITTPAPSGTFHVRLGTFDAALTPTALHAERGVIVATYYDGAVERYANLGALCAGAKLCDTDDAADPADDEANDEANEALEALEFARVRSQLDGPLVPLRRWQDVTLTDGSADLPAMSAQGIALLVEYRGTASMAGWWPCTAAALAEASADAADPADAGVSAEQVDWTDLPSPAASRRILLSTSSHDRRRALTAAEIAVASAE